MIAKTIQYDLYGKSFEEVAISRLKQYEPPEGYYLAFSGGKDSIVIYDLALRAGVKFDAHFHRTTVDPPEVLRFIKENYPDVIWEKPKASMFQLIIKNKMPPLRTIRYCCASLKEIGGKGRDIITGIRWAESYKRRKRGMYEESRHIKGKWFLHPIIDWSDKHVWEYISNHNLKYCCLYDKGKTRIGCIMCPMQGSKGMRKDAEMYPKFYRAYLRTFEKMLVALRSEGKEFDHGSTAEEVMNWWINSRKTTVDKTSDCRMSV